MIQYFLNHLLIKKKLSIGIGHRIFISPSVVEGVSMSIIESLASSLPVIVSKNVANYREIEEDKCGLVVETKVAQITKSLLKLENSKTENKLYANNSEISAIKRYDIKIVAKNIKEST